MEGLVDDGTGTCVVPEEECGCYSAETGEYYYEGQVFRPDPEDDCVEW
jgi:hypothetical protein